MKPAEKRRKSRGKRSGSGPTLIAPWYGSMALHWHLGSATARSEAIKRLRSAKSVKNPQLALQRLIEALDCLDMSEPQRLYLLLMEQQSLVSARKSATPHRMVERLLDVIQRLRRHEVRRAK